jgi:hypothetical protein
MSTERVCKGEGFVCREKHTHKREREKERKRDPSNTRCAITFPLPEKRDSEGEEER